MKLKYKLNWISSVDPNNKEQLDNLSQKMGDYYSRNSSYYKDIAESEFLWVDGDYIPHQKIIEAAHKANNILEIGCGESSILKYHPELGRKYSGIDFSEEIITKNKIRFPDADFSIILDPHSYPFQDQQFDLIFSVFVLEHTVYPKKILDECIRLLKPGGSIVILAPNYLDNGFLPSQQVSKDLSSGRDLIKKGNLIGTMRAILYNKILIPSKCRKLARNLPGFYINTNPLCFKVDEFRPDVDAVYVVSEKEIELYMDTRKFQKMEKETDFIDFTRERKLCFQIFKHIL